jgi:signal transduction histidine kinase
LVNGRLLIGTALASNLAQQLRADAKRAQLQRRVATTQTYLADNPLRVHDHMRNFMIG